MKNFGILVLAVVALSSLPAFAESKTLWSCDNGRDIEAAGVRQFHGKLTGAVSWDCFPGDGICSAEAVVTPGRDEAGNLTFKGRFYTLVIRTTVAPVNGAYNAKLVAKDMVDPASQGRGFVFNEAVLCKASQ